MDRIHTHLASMSPASYKYKNFVLLGTYHIFIKPARAGDMSFRPPGSNDIYNYQRNYYLLMKLILGSIKTYQLLFAYYDFQQNTKKTFSVGLIKTQNSNTPQHRTPAQNSSTKPQNNTAFVTHISTLSTTTPHGAVAVSNVFLGEYRSL